MFRLRILLRNLIFIFSGFIILESYHIIRLVFYLKNQLHNQMKISAETKNTIETARIFRPYCNCSQSSKSEYIKIQMISIEDDILTTFDKSLIVITHNEISNKSGTIQIKRKLLSKMTLNEFGEENLTCDIFGVLKRGKHQKVISFSFYGDNRKEFKYIEKMLKQIRTKYKGYSARIYYEDDWMDKNFRCRIECQYSDVVDFCNVNHFPMSLRGILQDEDPSVHFTDLSYMFRATWKILPIGDTYVDVFMSRNVESLIFQREIDSVNVWLNSNKYGHIMRGLCFGFLSIKSL